MAKTLTKIILLLIICISSVYCILIWFNLKLLIVLILFNAANNLANRINYEVKND